MKLILNGKKLAEEKERQLARKIAQFKKKIGITPQIVAILVGKDEASQIYLRQKKQASDRVGIRFIQKNFKKETPSETIINFINQLNKDPEIHGIMVQLPFPSELEGENGEFSILNAINPQKDVDCLTAENLGLLAVGQPRFLPATVGAIMEIIKCWQLKIEGLNCCVVGGSNIVGKPLVLHLSNLGATVIWCRSKTKNLGNYTRQADLLISATGVPGLIKKEMVKREAAVIDVGSPKGDVDFEVAKVVSFITPVPGGVGPLTVFYLMKNVFKSALALLKNLC